MIYIDIMQIMSFCSDLVADKVIGIADAVDDVPAGDAGFDGDECQWDLTEMMTDMRNHLLEEYEYFFRVPAIAQVIVTGIEDNGGWFITGHQSVEEPHAGGEG